MPKLKITRREALAATLGASALGAGCATTPAGAATFAHGVAAGDPARDRLVIWTRATTEAGDADVRLTWEVARDADFADVVATGGATATAARDFCAKADVGGLAPGTEYFYRFRAGDVISPVGRAKTLPEAGIESVTLAVFTCSNFPFGRFHAYRHMAERGDVDAAIHLGDYIYEYGGPGSWGWDESQANGRVHQPEKETVTLADYRTRYNQYRTDPDLQAAHAACAWIPTWDDHEIANNPWTDGAANHNDGEGTWADRKAAAMRAWFEWMPVREPEPGRAREAIQRSFRFGDLAHLVMLETRLTGRDKQLYYWTDLKWIETAYDVSDPDDPKPITDESQLVPHDPPEVERLRTPFDMTGAEPRPILDYDRAKLADPANLPPGIAFRRDAGRFRSELLNDPERRMMGADQERWLLDEITAAERGGVAWQVLGNQIMFARQVLPDLRAFYDADTLERLSANNWVRGAIELGQYGLPANLDAWDGYPVQRDRLTDAFSNMKAHPILVTGDTHAFWATNVADTAGAHCATEFGVSSVSSPGYGEAYQDLDPPITDVMVESYEGLEFTNGDDHGYLALTLTRESATCDMIITSHPSEAETTARVARRWVQPRRGADGALPDMLNATPRG